MSVEAFLLGLGCTWKWKCVFFLFVLTYSAKVVGVNLMSRHKLAVKSIQSEDGDIIDCIDVYKQPAFAHPALRKHKIQMAPSSVATTEMQDVSGKSKKDKKFRKVQTFQLWRKNGSCPMETIPIRRIRKMDLLKYNSAGMYGKKVPNFRVQLKKPNDDEHSQHLKTNRSLSILLTQGYNYNGAKADIPVFTPPVEYDDEYSTSRISLENGPKYNYESIESGWTVNPSVYGDRDTRIYVYWTVDGSNTTGCFDLICPGFVQTSNEIALGGVIRSIPVPGELPGILTLHIFKDPNTQNWWVRYQENINIGYWPSELFEVLYVTAETVQFGGEVYSSRLGHPGHTKTGMGSGELPEYDRGGSGWFKRIRIQDNSMVLKFPEWIGTYADDETCYNGFIYQEHKYISEPEFYFGGPGSGWQSWRCN